MARIVVTNVSSNFPTSFPVNVEHKIELTARNKFKSFCKKCFRLNVITWTWGLKEIVQELSTRDSQCHTENVLEAITVKSLNDKFFKTHKKIFLLTNKIPNALHHLYSLN